MDEKLADLLKTQKSLTEWLEDIKHADAATIRREDNVKRERLKVLQGAIGLPFDEPTQFEASDLRDDNPTFAAFLKQRGAEPCALRLLPQTDELPKLRMRGKTIKGAYAWFKEQHIDATQYKADFVPHPPDYSWATIFVVNRHGIQGEIIYGGHHQLTQGFHDAQAPHVFRYDFKKWAIEPQNNEALAHVKQLATFIHVPRAAQQKQLSRALGATFTHDYLQGYFETTNSSLGTWFIDYNQSLGEMLADVVITTTPAKQPALVKGRTGSPGQAGGQVCIVESHQLGADFPDGAVLVCAVTSPDYVPLMQKASAIVTDQGGILSHAAIVARELRKPCIVGTGDATTQLKSGEQVLVNADAGTVTSI